MMHGSHFTPRILVFLTVILVSAFAEARKETEYYTMVGTRATGCAMEGNKIVNGQLYFAKKIRGRWQCHPMKKYCPYGVGHRNNCIVPCVHAAAGRNHRHGSTVRLQKPFRCPWGPHKGKTITQVKIADIGLGLSPNQVDTFRGLCKKSVRDVCREWADDSVIARYGSGSRKTASTAARSSNTPYTARNTTASASRRTSKTARTRSHTTSSSRPRRSPPSRVRRSVPAATPSSDVDWREAAFSGGAYYSAQ